MGEIITIKNNKEQVGKSWITLQLGHAFTLLEKEDTTPYRVLLVTSDINNDILKFSGFKNAKVEKKLNDFIKTGELNEIKLRENLFYIPLEKTSFSELFKRKVKKSLEKLKNDFDLILIDSVPQLEIDKEFVEIADSVIVPTYLDDRTFREIFQLVKEIKKIIAVIPNRYTKSKKTDVVYGELKDLLERKHIFLTNPIKQSSHILNLLEDGKTIWDTKSSEVEETQAIIYQLMMHILNKKI